MRYQSEYLRACCGVDSPGVSTVREFVGGVLLRHTCQLVSNAHAITGIVRTDAGLPPSSASMVPAGLTSSGQLASWAVVGGATSSGADCEGGTSTVEQVRLATAIYPTASLMNHSCEPSIISRSQLPHCNILLYFIHVLMVILNVLNWWWYSGCGIRLVIEKWQVWLTASLLSRNNLGKLLPHTRTHDGSMWLQRRSWRKPVRPV